MNKLESLGKNFPEMEELINSEMLEIKGGTESQGCQCRNTCQVCQTGTQIVIPG